MKLVAKDRDQPSDALRWSRHSWGQGIFDGFCDLGGRLAVEAELQGNAAQLTGAVVLFAGERTLLRERFEVIAPYRLFGDGCDAWMDGGLSDRLLDSLCDRMADLVREWCDSAGLLLPDSVGLPVALWDSKLRFDERLETGA